jgi:hypothetical protein
MALALTRLADKVNITDLLNQADPNRLRTALSALIATHPELHEQVEQLLAQRSGALAGSVTTVAPLEALRAGWLYLDPQLDRWFRIVEIDYMLPGDSSRLAVLEPVLEPQPTSVLSTAIPRHNKPFVVKIPENRP